MPARTDAAVPEHVAIVMDGNGRWAKERGLKRTDGHRAGEEAVGRAVDGALELGVKHLTLYAFSTENWKRPPSEVRFLLDDTERFVARRRDDWHARGVRMRWIGRRERKVPKRILDTIDETAKMTARNTRMTLTIAFNYGSRAEIVDAARALAAQAADGFVDPKRIDERALRGALYAPDAPDVDLFLRTGGEQRMSNFLLWQSSYAELMFLDIFWPDFTAAHLVEAVAEFQRRARRFGKV
jgi:undecaprenyl diphosphate synthase